MNIQINRFIFEISRRHVYAVVPWVGAVFGELRRIEPGAPLLWSFDSWAKLKELGEV